MAKKLPLIFLLASYLFVSGVLSMSILTIENKCNHTVWPVVFSWMSEVSTTGFALKKDEARSIRTPSSWDGLISGRTLCSNNTSTGNFSCATGDCESGKMECPGSYSWAPVTYVVFRINNNGNDSYTISLEYGYNLPIMVTPSTSSSSSSLATCISSGCRVDLNKTCPDDLKTFSEEKPIACSSECKKYGTEASCCKSKENCKETVYRKNFERVCPLAYIYRFSDHNSTFICPTETNYNITFCPSSIPNNTVRNNNRSSKTPLGRPKPNSIRNLKPILGGFAALVVLIIIFVIVVILRLRAKNARRKSDSNNENIEAVVMLKRYSFDKVRKMTNSFSHVLGKGGFGTVYKGKLPDASVRDIAVKILKDSNGNGEDFINELASMSIASHVNIVSLIGFCYEGSKRAIICEYMPNGSLDKFISENMSEKMDWKILYNIAVGVARGLEYLHNSCASKIVHFDIKPQNILMDKDFCPKISDFGLAKLFNNKESIISLLDARGTIGYTAPEVLFKRFGKVSHKSDVYSYGMVVLEMIGARIRKRDETTKSNISSMYFPDWIYEDLERKEIIKRLGDHIVKEEEMIEKKMTLVGLWCIQTNPSDRPTMRKVVEMLEGSLEVVEVPPKPILGLPSVTAWEIVEDSEEETSSFLDTEPVRKIKKSLSWPRNSYIFRRRVLRYCGIESR